MTNEQLAILLEQIADNFERETNSIAECLARSPNLTRETKSTYIGPKPYTLLDYISSDNYEIKEDPEGEFVILQGLRQTIERLREQTEILKYPLMTEEQEED